MRRAVLFVCAVVAIFTIGAMPASSTNVTPGLVSSTPAAPPRVQCTAAGFRPFSEAVWRLVRWERGKPPVKVIQAQRRRLACAGPENRKAMRKRWRKDKHAYYQHRSAKLAARNMIQAVIDAVGMGTLEAIAACESGGSPTAVSPNGTYRGKYQFDYGTWASVGGSGDPAAAPEREQDYRAALLYQREGSSPWPICG